MSIVSISEASRLVNRCRQTIYKHIRQGKLSTSICVDGSKGLDTSELIRVYGVLTVNKATSVDINNNKQQTTNVTVDTVNVNSSKLIELEKEIALARLKIEQQEKELHYKQTIIDNKQEIIDSLKTTLKLLGYRQEKNDVILPKEQESVSQPQKIDNNNPIHHNSLIRWAFKLFK